MTMTAAATFDASIWQGRNDTGERGDVTRLFQIVQPADAVKLSGTPAVLGFACDAGVVRNPVSYTHLTLPTNTVTCRSRWSPYH